MLENLRLTNGSQPASDYGPAPSDMPSCYPGRRPLQSYILNDQTINYIDDERSGPSIDEHLEGLAAAPLKDRHSILGYGSNINPAQLISKFGTKHKPIVVLTGWLNDHDIVYMPHVSLYGAVSAALNYSPGTKAQVGITLLDDEQLDLMSGTEGAYSLCDLPRNVSVLGEPLSCRYYKSKDVLLMDGEPVRLAEIRAIDSKHTSMPQTEILDSVARITGFSTGAELSMSVRRDKTVHARVNETLRSHSMPVRDADK